eukprot:Skav206961  [mRNA]  locus=scaffold255:195063:195525:- [translate_table: standard]
MSLAFGIFLLSFNAEAVEYVATDTELLQLVKGLAQARSWATVGHHGVPWATGAMTVPPVKPWTAIAWLRLETRAQPLDLAPEDLFLVVDMVDMDWS